MQNISDEQIAQVHELHVLLSVLWKASMQHLEAWLNEHRPDVTRLQFGILRLLHHEGDHILSDLSKKFGLDPSTLVPTINAMEKKGFVQRARDPDDRRRVNISITPLGQEIVRGSPVIDPNQAIVRAMDAIGTEKTRALLDLLAEMISAMPDSAKLMDHIQARLKSFGAKEHDLICKQDTE